MLINKSWTKNEISGTGLLHVVCIFYGMISDENYSEIFLVTLLL